MSYCNTDKYIKLRNNIFYFTMELPRQNGKRRFFCKSLHTYNYYEAREKAKIVAEQMINFDQQQFINEFNTLWEQVQFEYDSVGGDNIYAFAERRISPRTNPMVLKRLANMENQIGLIQQQLLDISQKINFQQYEHYLPEIKQILAGIQDIKNIQNQPIQLKPAKNYTIHDILVSLLKKRRGCRTRKKP